jgi:ABC-type multidrug transport system permease subunit
VVARLVAARQEFEARQRSSVNSTKDPELDQFMVQIIVFCFGIMIFIFILFGFLG